MLTTTLMVLALSVAAAIVEAASPSFHHRHSFISSLPVEPTDDNFKVATHEVEVKDLDGFREWQIKGPIQAFSRLVGNVIQSDNINGLKNTTVHVQWYRNEAPLLRPPFTPSFIPGFHLAITSGDFDAAWKEYCPILTVLTGATDCSGQSTPLEEEEDQNSKPVNAQHLIPIHQHHYVHRTQQPPGFLSSSPSSPSVLSTLISGTGYQLLSGFPDNGSAQPALIDMVLKNDIVDLRIIWPTSGGSVKILFNEETDSVTEVGWFYRETTENEQAVYDHYLGAVVRMDPDGETVREALIQARSPVFPPHKRQRTTGEIAIPGHGYSSKMSPAQTFHPHSITTIHSNPYISDTTHDCSLYVMQVLPTGVFVDPFQLEGLAPEIGQATVFGETDLEKPVGVVSGWGSIVMVKVQPEDSAKTSRWISTDKETIVSEDREQNETSRKVPKTGYTATVDIPMHMRYQPPAAKDDPSTHVKVAVPWPIVPWVCPIDQTKVDSDGYLISPAKKLFHIPPMPLNLLFPTGDDEKGAVEFRFLLPEPIPQQYPESHVSVPVGRLKDLTTVRTATFALALVGTVAVGVALFKAVTARSAEKGKQD